MITVAALNDTFRRLATRAGSAIATVQALVDLARKAADEAQQAADRAQHVLHIEESVEERDGVVRVRGALGSVTATLARLAEVDGELLGLSTNVELLDGEVRRRLTRETYDAIGRVGVLAAPAQGDAVTAVSVHSLTAPLGPGAFVAEPEDGGGAVRLVATGTVAPPPAGSDGAVAVAIEPRALDLPAGTPIYLPTAVVQTALRELAGEFERLQTGTGLTGLTLFGEVADGGVPEGEATALPLKTLELDVAVGELMAVTAANGERLIATATAVVARSDEPVAVPVEPLAVPAGGVEAGAPVTYALSELTSLFRQTLQQFGRAVTEADLTAAAGVAEAAETVDDEARTQLTVTPVDLGDEDALIERGGLLVLLTDAGPVNLSLTDDHHAGTADEGVALRHGDTVLRFQEARFSVEPGKAVVLPARYSYTYAVQTAQRFFQQASDGVSQSELDQTAASIRAEVAAGVLLSYLSITPSAVTLAGGRSLVLSSGAVIEIGQLVLSQNQLGMQGALDLFTQGGVLSLIGGSGTTVRAASGNLDLSAPQGAVISHPIYIGGHAVATDQTLAASVSTLSQRIKALEDWRAAGYDGNYVIDRPNDLKDYLVFVDGNLDYVARDV